GVDFGDGNIAKLLIGIAGKNNEHLEILSKIAIVCSEQENVEAMIKAATEEEILRLLNEVN
ncbi:PTS mannitol transporter subunit IIA, partial [Geobacillus sp. 44B]